MTEAIELLKETLILYAAWSELVDKIAETFHAEKTWGKLGAAAAALIVFIYIFLSKKSATDSSGSRKNYRYRVISRIAAAFYAPCASRPSSSSSLPSENTKSSTVRFPYCC